MTTNASRLRTPSSSTTRSAFTRLGSPAVVRGWRSECGRNCGWGGVCGAGPLPVGAPGPGPLLVGARRPGPLLVGARRRREPASRCRPGIEMPPGGVWRHIRASRRGGSAEWAVGNVPAGVRHGRRRLHRCVSVLVRERDRDPCSAPGGWERCSASAQPLARCRLCRDRTRDDRPRARTSIVTASSLGPIFVDLYSCAMYRSATNTPVPRDSVAGCRGSCATRSFLGPDSFSHNEKCPEKADARVVTNACRRGSRRVRCAMASRARRTRPAGRGSPASG